jgi:3-deoxy-D-manno-octulosonic-acid transferase
LAGRVSVVRYPLDLSRYVERFLDRVRPDVAVLMELEVWPNFVLACQRRGIPVLLVNGRLTERSYRGYRRFRALVRPVFSALSAVCAQEAAYATRFVDLGVAEARVSVTGTMKFDSAQVGERVEGDEELAEALGLNPRALRGPDPLLVCGSTGPGEEEVLLEVYLRLRLSHPTLRLVIVPRKPERFDEVAQLMGRAGQVIRRSTAATQAGERSAHASAMVLGDTMGELRKFYSLADVVVIGRTLLDLGEKQHGSDMIEPAALGKPVVVGPYTGNFAEPMRALLAADAIRQIAASTPVAAVAQLVNVIDAWLADPAAAEEVGRRAREVVLANRGATQRHVQLILDYLQRASAASHGAE